MIIFIVPKQNITRIHLIYSLIIVNIFFFFDIVLRVLPNIFVPQLQQIFHIGPTKLGFFSTAFMYGYGFAQIPAGILIDRYGIKKTLTSALSVALIALISFSLSQSFILAIVARFILGAAFALAFLLCVSVITIHCSKKHQAKLISISMLVGALGGIFTNNILAFASLYYTHQQVIFGIVMLILLLLVLSFFIPQQLSHRTSSASIATVSFKRYFLENVNCARVWQLSLIAASLYLPYAILNDLWGIPFFQLFDHLTKLPASHIISAIWLGWIIGSVTIGILQDKFQSLKILLVYSVLIELVGLCCLIYLHLPFMVLILLALCLGAGASSMELCYLGLPKKSQNALFIGFVNTMVTVFVVVFLPVISHLIAIKTRPESKSALHHAFEYNAHGMQMAFMLLVIVLLFGLGVTASLKAKVPRQK